MKRIRAVVTALLLTIMLPGLGPATHLALPVLGVAPALASGTTEEVYDVSRLSDGYGSASASVDGLFSYNGSTVSFVGYGSAVGTGGVVNSGSWTLYSNQGPGYYFNTGSTQITFWFNEKMLNGHGTAYCAYPRAVGYSNSTTSGYDGDGSLGVCNF
jgi:hypothetical protein